MKQELHTVLGANGAVGQAVIEELKRRGFDYRAVSRSLNQQIPQNFRADLLQAGKMEAAVEGSAYVYLCVGLPLRGTKPVNP